MTWAELENKITFKKKRNDSEHEIQKAYFKILALNENKYPFLRFIFAIPNGGARHIKVAMKMKAEGVKRGVPDIFIPMHNIANLNGCFLETKSEKGKLSKEQEEYMNYLVLADYDYNVCKSVEELVSATENYLNIKLKNNYANLS